jgi:hypothetical protein
MAFNLDDREGIASRLTRPRVREGQIWRVRTPRSLLRPRFAQSHDSPPNLTDRNSQNLAAIVQVVLQLGIGGRQSVTSIRTLRRC